MRVYLHNRIQSAKIHNCECTPRPTNYGVPQGSVLGLIRFFAVLIISPIYLKISTLYVLLSIQHCISLVKIQLIWFVKLIPIWTFLYMVHSLQTPVTFNKTFYMQLTDKQIKKIPPLFYHNSNICKTSHHTLLGMTYDRVLTFRLHILKHHCQII